MIVSPPLTFPRELIGGADVMAACDLLLTRQQTMAPTRGGTPMVADAGRPLWEWTYRTRPLAEPDVLAVEAWLDSLRGGLRSFKASHPLRRYLVGYRDGYGGLVRAGGGSFAAGTAAVVSLGPLLDRVTINTLPNGLQFAPGDMLSIAHPGNRRGLYRIAEAATSVAGAATIIVEPTLLPTITAGSEVTLLAPYCHAALETKSVRVQWQRGRLGVVSFEAVQVL